MVATLHITINNSGSKLKTLFWFFVVFFTLPSWEKKNNKKTSSKFFTFLPLKVPWLPCPKRPDVLPDTSDKLQLLF